VFDGSHRDIWRLRFAAEVGATHVPYITKKWTCMVGHGFSVQRANQIDFAMTRARFTADDIRFRLRPGSDCVNFQFTGEPGQNRRAWR
jgi:hypothetical protein